MKTIYMTGNRWQNRTPRAEPDRAAGGDKVVDLAAWKVEHLTQPDGPEPERMSAPERYGGRERVRRRHRRWEAARDRAELAATLAVTAALVALIVRVLLF